MYIDKSIREYLNAVASNEPIPGGGSVSALVSSLGGALTLMTSNHSFNKDYFKELDPDIQEKVKDSHEKIKKSIGKLNYFIDEDAKGFASVIEAYDKKDSESKEENKKRLEDSYKKALATPLSCSRECLELLKHQGMIVEYGNKETITDVGVGVVITYAALEGCIMSVKINLNYLEDRDFIEKTQDELNNIYKEADVIHDFLKEKIDRILA